MREFQEILIDKPELVYDHTPFKVVIPGGARAYIFEHNKPVAATSLMAGDKRPKDEFSNDLAGIIAYITDDRSKETDIYGVVELKTEDLTSQIVDIASLGESGKEVDEKKAAAEYKALRDRHMKNARGALEDARVRADARVKRALKITHVNLVKQWEALAQQGLGKYTPSMAEAVGAFILKEEVEKASARKRELVDRMLDVAKNTVVM